MYYSRYSAYTYSLPFYKPLGRREWMDGIGCVWMTHVYLTYLIFDLLSYLHITYRLSILYCPQGGTMPPWGCRQYME
jgi:hypothetical protein